MHEVIDGKITMSTGVAFKIMDIPLMVFDSINKKMRKERPQIPVCYIEGKDREELNPNAPEYLIAMEDWEAELNAKLLDASIVLGIQVHRLPEDFPKPEDTPWAEKLKRLDIDISDDSDDRLLAWIKFCAAPTVKDLNSLILACSRNIGVTEEDLASSAELFRNRKERRAGRKPSS